MRSAREAIEEEAGIRASDLGLNRIEIIPVRGLKFVPVPKQVASQDGISTEMFRRGPRTHRGLSATPSRVGRMRGEGHLPLGMRPLYPPRSLLTAIAMVTNNATKVTSSNIFIDIAILLRRWTASSRAFPGCWDTQGEETGLPFTKGKFHICRLVCVPYR